MLLNYWISFLLKIGKDLVSEIKNADQSTEEGLFKQRERVKILEQKLGKIDSAEAKRSI